MVWLSLKISYNLIVIGDIRIYYYSHVDSKMYCIVEIKYFFVILKNVNIIYIIDCLNFQYTFNTNEKILGSHKYTLTV